MEVEGSLMSCANQQQQNQHQDDSSFANAESTTCMAGTPMSEGKSQLMVSQPLA